MFNLRNMNNQYSPWGDKKQYMNSGGQSTLQNLQPNQMAYQNANQNASFMQPSAYSTRYTTNKTLPNNTMLTSNPIMDTWMGSQQKLGSLTSPTNTFNNTPSFGSLMDRAKEAYPQYFPNYTPPYEPKTFGQYAQEIPQYNTGGSPLTYSQPLNDRYSRLNEVRRRRKLRQLRQGFRSRNPYSLRGIY